MPFRKKNTALVPLFRSKIFDIRKKVWYNIKWYGMQTERRMGMVPITDVLPRSRAARAGLCAGDVLVSLNGHEIHDVLDYRFYRSNKCNKFRRLKLYQLSFDLASTDKALKFRLFHF